MDHGERAYGLFLQGYNCAQSVVVAFSEDMGMEPDFAARISSSFGGGVGRMREVCGAVSGMAMVLGVLYGYDTPGDDTVKQAHYARVQELAGEFRRRCGSIVCRELLDNPSADPVPTPRTEDFYHRRPCGGFVRLAAELVEDYLRRNPVECQR